MLNGDMPIAVLVKNLCEFNAQDAATWTYVTNGDAPCPATVFILSDSDDAVIAEFNAAVSQVAQGEIVFVCSATERINRPAVSLQVLLYKSICGESLLQVNASILRTTRAENICRYTAKIRSLYRQFRSVNRIFSEFAAAGDPNGWNTWCAPLNEGVVLKGLTCYGLDLSYFDLCAADLIDCDFRNCKLNYANFAGAFFNRCLLDGVTADGADFFNAIVSKRYESVLVASGMVERESVTLL